MPASAACMLWKRANYTESEYLSLARSQPAQNRKSQTSQSQITTTVVVSFQNRNSESQTESQNVSAPHQFVSCYLQNHNSKYITSPKMVSTPSLVFMLPSSFILLWPIPHYLSQISSTPLATPFHAAKHQIKSWSGQPNPSSLSSRSSRHA